MGRSRGGLTTKIHALVDANGLPILLKLTPGQAHDGRRAGDMLDGLGQGQILLADRGYDSDALRARLEKQAASGNIKPMPNRVNVPSFSRYLYRLRNLVERFFNKLKHFRAVATRYEKHDADDCQSALNIDPLSASKTDPDFAVRTAGSARPGEAGRGCAAGASAVR